MGFGDFNGTSVVYNALSVERNAQSVVYNAQSVERNVSSVVYNAPSVVYNAPSVERNALSVERNASSVVYNGASVKDAGLDVSAGPRQSSATALFMKRHFFYPRRSGEQASWLLNFANKLGSYAAALGVSGADAAACIADARWGAFVIGTWLPAVRAFAPSTTDAVAAVMNGTEDAVTTLPGFTAPGLPAGVSPRADGALGRIFAMAATLKLMKNFTDSVGVDLGILGSEDVRVAGTPKFTVATLRGDSAEGVRLVFFKYGHTGVFIETRRGGGAWETLGIDTESPYDDERPLLSPTTPEVREYRMRFWDKGTPNGDWTDVAKTTVSP